jgi:hypothetical protein
MEMKINNYERSHCEFLKFFKMSLMFYEDKHKCSASEKINGNCHAFADSRWAMRPSLLLTDSEYLGISQCLSNIL